MIMTPYQFIRLSHAFYYRNWRMPIATLIRHFGVPDLRGSNPDFWIYVITPHIRAGTSMTDLAFMIRRTGSAVRYGAVIRLNWERTAGREPIQRRLRYRCWSDG
jgi:hypothetical protein